MILSVLAASGIILLALGVWLLVQAGARRIAARYPQLGPAREPRAHGCGGCACVNDKTGCGRERIF